MNKNIRNITGTYRFALIMVLCLATGYLNAQEEYKQTRKGNKAYEQEDYDKATEHYEQALEENAGFTKAHNNLASSYYRKEEYEKAAEHFEKATLNETERENLAEYYYNLGNSYLQANKLDKSIEAYKESLRIDPSDRQTKHNLSIANKRKQQQQKQQDQQNDQNDQNDKNDQNDQDKQDKQDKQDQQKQDQQQDQQQQDKQKQNQQQDQQQQPKEQMKKEDAERLLNLIEQNEKELLKKLEEEKSKQQKRDADKNW